MATSLSTAGPPSNTWFLGPIRVHSPNSKSVGSAVSVQFTAESAYTLQWGTGPFPPKLSLLMGGWGPPSFSWFLEADRAHNPNCITIGSAIFAQVTVECLYTLQWVPLSQKIAPSHWGSGPPCKTRFLGPIRAHRPNGISIRSAVFPQTTVECPYSLQWDAHCSPKICRFPWGIWTPI